MENLQEIAELIREWKVIDTDGQITTQNHWFFGRDKPNRPVKRQRVSYAFHAHLQPMNPTDQAAWDALADDNKVTPYQRTSDRIAVYSLKDSEPSAGLLLFDIVDDPGGHGIFDPANVTYARLLRAWDRAAQRHQDAGALPAGVITFR